MFQGFFFVLFFNLEKSEGKKKHHFHTVLDVYKH